MRLRTFEQNGRESRRGSWTSRGTRSRRLLISSNLRSRAAAISFGRPASISAGVTKPDGAVQSDHVVMVHILLDQAPCVLRRQWRSRSDAFSPLIDLYRLAYRALANCAGVY